MSAQVVIVPSSDHSTRRDYQEESDDGIDDDATMDLEVPKTGMVKVMNRVDDDDEDLPDGCDVGLVLDEDAVEEREPIHGNPLG